MHHSIWVTLDPEMLGKVLEACLKRDGRRGKSGTFCPHI